MDGNRPRRRRAQKLQRLLVGVNVRVKHFIAHRRQEEIHFDVLVGGGRFGH